MSNEHQPEAVWVFPEEKKSNKGAVWLIVILSILAVTIVGLLLFFLLPPAGDTEPTPSPSASGSASATPTPTRTPTPTATPTLSPSATPTPVPSPSTVPTDAPNPTEPPAPNQDHDAFAAAVAPRLNDASTGLGVIAEGDPDAAGIVGNLQQDAGRLSDTAAPSDIEGAWADAVTQYSARLAELRAAYDNGTDPQQAVDAASAALQNVRAVAGI
ncbi:hypothetical protein ACSS7Z_05770 [Microbacterium sp. A82]|uniref:hypothetical protein n=1 Tax=Microbacterium sp. A82 TaxID=3450452 RepID=UPI003F3C4BC5